MGRVPKKLLLLCTSLVVCLGLSECAFRIYAEARYEAKLKQYEERPDDFIQVVRNDPVQFVLIPDNKHTMTIPAGESWPARKWTFSVSKDGFRGAPLSLDFRPDELRILVIGDSYPFGFAINDDETLPYQLEQLMNTEDSQRRVRVVNGGVPGTNSVQHYHLLRRAFDRIKPHVVLLMYVMNDAEPLCLVPNPPSYVYRHYTFWSLAEARDVFNRVTGTKFFEVTKPRYTHEYLRGFHPDSHQWRESKAALGQMAGFCREKKIAFGVFVFPDMTQPFTFEYGLLLIHALVKQWGAEDGYPVVDLFPIFHGQPNGELCVRGDWHPNRKAHGMAAKEMAKYLKLVLSLIK